jgi:radical SAM superfamily enzyme YgiQ (UPF0313 family)
MNILLINIALRESSPVKLLPIGLAYVASAMKRAGFKFDLLDIDAHRYSDREVEDFIKKKPYDVVGMGCIFTGYKIVKALTELIKKHHPNSLIIAGNSVATSIMETILTKTKVDIAVMGEGDDTIVDLLQTISMNKTLEEVNGICFLKEDKIVRTPPRPLIEDISSIPFIDYSIFDVETYIVGARSSLNDPLPIPRERIRALPINTSRGCIYNCDFCYQVFRGMKYRIRSAAPVVSEMKILKKQYSLDYFILQDEMTFYNRRQALEFAQEIIDQNLSVYWCAVCRADFLHTEEDSKIARKLKGAGCVGLCFALESADPEILRSMKKKITVEQFSRQAQLFKKEGLSVWTSLVFGYPQETPETIRKTIDICIKNRIYPSAGYVLPQPGSPMYDYCIKRKIITDEEGYLLTVGDRQDLRINLTSMSNEELEFQVTKELKRCSDSLGLDLHGESLIKTGFYRGKPIK